MALPRSTSGRPACAVCGALLAFFSTLQFAMVQGVPAHADRQPEHGGAGFLQGRQSGKPRLTVENRTANATVHSSSLSPAQCRTVKPVSCVENGAMSDEIVSEHHTALDLMSLQLYSCPFYRVPGNTVDSGCSGDLLTVCGVTAFSSSPPLQIGRDSIPIEAVRNWMEAPNPLIHISYDRYIWQVLRRLTRLWKPLPIVYSQEGYGGYRISVPVESSAARWLRNHRPGKSFCDNILPNTSQPIPCTRPLYTMTCMCPWEIMPDMCDQLLKKQRRYHYQENGDHVCVIKFFSAGFQCSDSWPENRCTVFKDMHRDYTRRRRLWKCPRLPDDEYSECGIAVPSETEEC